MKPEDIFTQHTKTSPVAWSDANRPGDGPGADVPPRPAPGPLSTIAPAFRAVDQLSGKIAELEAENASLHCRCDELSGALVEEREKLQLLTAASDALIDELHEQLREAQAQRDQARSERDEARARLQ